jgi:glutathione S-transferase
LYGTRADHSILGLKATSAKRSFHLIRTDLAKETGNDKVTVPTIKVGDGEYITDSWAIAEYVSLASGCGR